MTTSVPQGHEAAGDALRKSTSTRSRDAGTIAPRRFQRSRAPGWRAPDGAVFVGRGTEWGNPATVSDRQRGGIYWVRTGPDDPRPTRLTDRADAHALAVAHYRERLQQNPDFVTRIRRMLRGRDLMCWCSVPDDPCHADVLLCVANDMTMEQVREANTRAAKGEARR
jgi:hypothetical protein